MDLRELSGLLNWLSQYPKEGFWFNWGALLFGLVGVLFAAIQTGIRDPLIPRWSSYLILAVSLLAWGYGVPLMIAQFLINVWDRSTERKLQAMTRSFDEVANTLAQKRIVLAGLPDLTEYKQISRVVGDLAGPVLGRAVRVQKNDPIISQFNLDVTALRTKEMAKNSGAEEVFGRFLDVESRSNWIALLTTEVPKLCDLISPRFVTTYTAWSLPFFRELCSQGFVDSYYPVPSAWVKNADPKRREQTIARLRKENWFENTTFSVGGVSLGSGRCWRPHEEESIKDILIQCGVSKKTFQKPDIKQKLESLVRETLCVWLPEPSNSELAERVLEAHARREYITVEIATIYRLWIKRKDTEVLYRYEIAFSRPLFVKRISFSLHERLVKEWVLDPPSIHSAFELDESGLFDESKSEKECQKDLHLQKKRVLQWIQPGTFGYGTPFLPGHGVDFFWRGAEH